MPWVRLDDRFTDHAKIDGLSDAAFRLHVAALCHCNRDLTDGFVAVAKVARLVPNFRRRTPAELVAAGVWDEVDGGWRIHDYLEFQPSKAKVEAERAAAAERQQKWREKKAKGRRNGVSNAVSHAAPTQPDPLEVGVGSPDSPSNRVAPPPESGAGGDVPIDPNAGDRLRLIRQEIGA